MEELIDLVATDASASDISAKIKELLFAKSSERIEAMRPSASSSLFGIGDGEENDDQSGEG